MFLKLKQATVRSGKVRNFVLKGKESMGLGKTGSWLVTGSQGKKWKIQGNARLSWEGGWIGGRVVFGSNG